MSRLRRTYSHKKAAAYSSLLVLQGGACGVCGRTDRELELDHDHICCNGCEYCWRGLVCHSCNLKLKEDGKRTTKQLLYLARYAIRISNLSGGDSS